jgi:hypothetical protein
MEGFDMELTENKISRLAKDWSTIAGEPVETEQIGGAIYGFCSELGALRIFYKYRYTVTTKEVVVNYNPNRKSWFFRLEI